MPDFGRNFVRTCAHEIDPGLNLAADLGTILALFMFVGTLQRKWLKDLLLPALERST